MLHHCPALRKAGFDAAFFSNKMVRKLTFGIFMMLFGKIILGFVLLSVISVAIYRWAPVRYTPLMAIRSVEQMLDGHKVHCEHKWVPLDEMSRHMPMAVIASEDNRFASHHGFDFVEIKKAVREAENGGRHRGASTISQQTAKNVFLWPSSSWVRKGFEAYFTVLIEALWSKERIMEVYLNSIETGDGLYGVEAVAEQNFNTTADQLTARQCALIAATLPNPLRFDSANPSSYMKKRRSQILRLMRLVPKFPPEED